jgi:hypothetical protein
MFRPRGYLVGAFEPRRNDCSLLQGRRNATCPLTLEPPGISSTLALCARDGAPGADAMAVDERGRIVSQLALGAYIVRIGVGSATERETGRYTLRVRSGHSQVVGLSRECWKKFVFDGNVLTGLLRRYTPQVTRATDAGSGPHLLRPRGIGSAVTQTWFYS